MARSFDNMPPSLTPQQQRLRRAELSKESQQLVLTEAQYTAFMRYLMGINHNIRYKVKLPERSILKPINPNLPYLVYIDAEDYQEHLEGIQAAIGLCPEDKKAVCEINTEVRRAAGPIIKPE